VPGIFYLKRAEFPPKSARHVLFSLANFNARFIPDRHKENSVKIAFRRSFAIEVLLRDVKDKKEVARTFAMSNDELLDALDLYGAFYAREEIAGVFDALPDGHLDAEVVGDAMGWPIDLDSYLDLSK
jgi:hypothetical protein